MSISSGTTGVRAAQHTQQMTFQRVHYRGGLPWPGHLVAIGAPPATLRGAPAVLPSRRPGINTQRLAIGAPAVTCIAGLVSPAAAVPLLLGALGLQLGFGLRKSLQQATLAVRDGRKLRASTRKLEGAPAARGSTTLGAGRTRAGAVRLNEEHLLRDGVNFGPAGVLPAMASAASAAGVLMKPEMFGALSASAAVASPAVISIAVPAAASFAVLGGAYVAYYLRLNRALSRHAPQISHRRVTGFEPFVQSLYQAHLRDGRVQAAFAFACYMAVAAGAPATLFGGPWGMAVLVPGVLCYALSSYTWARRMGYVSRVSDAEKLALSNRHLLINAIARDQRHYLSIKHFKQTKRLTYPFGLDSPAYPWVRLVNRARRRLHPAAVAREPAAGALLRDYWRAHLAIERTHAAAVLAIHARPRRAGRLPSEASVARQRAAVTELARLRREEAHIPAPLTTETAATMRWALRVLVQEDLFPSFAHAVASDATLTAFFSGGGVHVAGGRWTVDGAAMEATLDRLARANGSPPAAVASHFWQHAERAVVRDRKTAHEHRVRELLDVLALRLHVPASSEAGRFRARRRPRAPGSLAPAPDAGASSRTA
jgi:hypothetical protein